MQASTCYGHDNSYLVDALAARSASATTAQDGRLDDPRSLPAWQCAVDAGPQTVLLRFPQARALLDHMARPVADDAEPLFALAKYEDLYLKLTTHNVRELLQSFFARVVKSYGAARIAWGSNYPAAAGPLSALLANARQALVAFSAAQRDWSFSRTAKNFCPALA